MAVLVEEGFEVMIEVMVDVEPAGEEDVTKLAMGGPGKVYGAPGL
jgi:hypothetical protein